MIYLVLQKRVITSAVFSEALTSIKKLSNNEKVLMAHCLISELENKSDNGGDEAWAQLAQQRFDELQSGQVKGVSWDKIKQSIIS